MPCATSTELKTKENDEATFLPPALCVFQGRSHIRTEGIDNMRAISASSRTHLLAASLSLLAVMCCAPSVAQDADTAQVSSATAIQRPLIVAPVNEAQLTILKGNTHPLARREFDLG